ncbi:hypothetical protein BVRB_5g106440 [Beta vulgaris subsp. vulgaris]|nr:hypothetical protein BVRB_5g106440 [Beta vulgaris subsp. vulgaris]
MLVKNRVLQTARTLKDFHQILIFQERQRFQTKSSEGKAGPN